MTPLVLNLSERLLIDQLAEGRTIQAAATELGISRHAAGLRLLAARERNYCATTYQLLYRFGMSRERKAQSVMRLETQLPPSGLDGSVRIEDDPVG